jgi:glutaconate CoA-transferase subunit B
MQPEPETNEFIVTSLHPGVNSEQVRQNTGWDLRFAAGLSVTEPPTQRELEALRELNARTAQAHGTTVVAE